MLFVASLPRMMLSFSTFGVNRVSYWSYRNDCCQRFNCSSGEIALRRERAEDEEDEDEDDADDAETPATPPTAGMMVEESSSTSETSR